MKNIRVQVSKLSEIIKKMSEEQMSLVTLSIVDGIKDQDYYPSFLHLEACSNNGVIKDYESIDTVDDCLNNDDSDTGIEKELRKYMGRLKLLKIIAFLILCVVVFFLGYYVGHTFG